MSSLEMDTMLVFLSQEVEKFKKLLGEVRGLLSQLDEPLDVRWQMYLLIQPFLKTRVYYANFRALPKSFSWYDDMNLDRYAVQQLDQEFVDEIQGKSDDDEWSTYVNIASLKEEILELASQGYGSFENDW